MRKNTLLSFAMVATLGVSCFLTGCGCKKSIDSSKAYEYLNKAHLNLKKYYKGDFNTVSTYKYDVMPSIAPLSNGDTTNVEEYSAVITGDKSEKKYGKYIFDSTKIISSTYNVGDEVVSVDDDNVAFKSTKTNAYEYFINSLYEENQSTNINEYLKNEAKKVLKEKFRDSSIEFEGDFNDLSIDSYLQSKVFTINYTFSHNVNVAEGEAVLLVGGKLQFDEKNMIYTAIDLSFILNGENHEYKITHKYKDEYIDPLSGGNILSGLRSMLDIDYEYFEKLVNYEKSFALLIYSKNCVHCKHLADSFNYSSNVVYTLVLENLKNAEEGKKIQTLLNTIDDSVPSNVGSHGFSTPAIIRFDHGKIKYVSYGYVDTSNQYNYDLLVSVIEGTFTGDAIIYQN